LNQDWYYWVPPFYGDDNVTTSWHTDCLNGNLKAYAAWWLWARLADWDGTPNRAPVANAQSLSTSENTSKAITLVSTDADNDPLTWTIVSQPTSGNLTGTAPNLTYNPNAGYNGSDSFTFRTNDGNANSNTATVSITVGTATVISITITDSGAAGIHFGSLSPGTNNATDTDSSSTTPSIIVNVAPETSANVDLQIKGTDFVTSTFPVTKAKYSLTYAGAKTALSASYATFATNIAPSSNATLWHWLDVPSSGVTTGTYTSTFSYKAIAH
jgi:hypothetical protein